MEDENGHVDESFEQLVERYEIPLLQYATRIIGDRDRARDVVQETFVRLRRRVGEPGSVAAWLFTVCRNRALNVCRKERRLVFLSDELLDAQTSREPPPGEMLAQKESHEFLLQIIATLPPRQQEVLQLKFQNGLSYQEIGEITKLSVSNVGFLLHTSLKTLRQHHSRASREFLPFTPRTS